MEMKEKDFKIEEEFKYKGKKCIVIYHTWDDVVKKISSSLKDYYTAYAETNLSIPYNVLGIDVHGGLTFDGELKQFPIMDGINLAEKYKGLKFYGFDTGHAYDTPEKQHIDYVVKEVKKLADQIIKLERKLKRLEKEGKFMCVKCGKTYNKGLTDREAKAQLKKDFQWAREEDCSLVCDDCFKEMFEP